MNSLMHVFLFLLLSQGIAAQAENYPRERCEHIFSNDGLLARKVLWPPSIPLLSQGTLYANLKLVAENGNPSEIYPPRLLHPLIQLLRAQVHMTQSELSEIWELGVRVIQSKTPSWQAKKRQSTDGAIVYVGLAGPSLVITPDARLFLTTVFETEFNAYGSWVFPNYSRAREIPKGPYQQ